MRWQWSSSTVVLFVTGVGLVFAILRSSIRLMTVSSTIPVAEGLISIAALLALGAMLAGFAQARASDDLSRPRAASRRR